MKEWTIKIKFKVSDSWIADGFDLSDDEQQERIKQFFEEELISYANAGVETKCEIDIQGKPDKKEIRKLQGYSF